MSFGVITGSSWLLPPAHFRKGFACNMVVDDDMDNIGMSERFVCMMGNIPAKIRTSGGFCKWIF